MSEWVKVGDAAPEFSLQATDGSTVQLSELKGQPVVLYFYPKDDTPGCTIEACAFRDRKAELADLGVVVLGVSPDSIESHGAFSQKFDLNFPLLADTDHKVAEAYGAWRERTRDGKKFMGIQRSTFVIDANGTLASVWETVSVEGHDGEVLQALQQLSGR